MIIKQVFLASLLFKKVRVRGGDAYLLFWPRGWALIRGRALIISNLVSSVLKCGDLAFRSF